jgi:hypothetical protein
MYTWSSSLNWSQSDALAIVIAEIPARQSRANQFFRKFQTFCLCFGK